MNDIKNDELRSLINSLIKLYPVLKFDCVAEWINSVYDNYIRNDGKQAKNKISTYSTSIQTFCNFFFITPDILLKEDFEERIKRINEFKEHFNTETTFKSHKRRVKSFYAHYGLLAERLIPRVDDNKSIYDSLFVIKSNLDVSDLSKYKEDLNLFVDKLIENNGNLNPEKIAHQFLYRKFNIPNPRNNTELKALKEFTSFSKDMVNNHRFKKL